MSKKKISTESILEQVANLKSEHSHAYADFTRNAEIKSLPANTLLFSKGDRANDIYLLISGSLIVYVDGEYDQRLVLTHIEQMEFVGEMGYFVDERVRTANIITKDTCVVAKMSYAQFTRFIRDNNEFLIFMCKHLAGRLRSTSEHVSSMVFDDASIRVMDLLLAHAKGNDAVKYAEGIGLKITQVELASILGVSRETVGRSIRALEKHKILIKSGKQVLLLFPQAVIKKHLENGILPSAFELLKLKKK